MKAHTTGFKNGIKELGRQLRAVITYGNTTLEEEIYSISPHFEANILKSVMKQLDVELSVDIPLETVINCKIGILVNGQYEMLNYGNYVVYKSEKQEDTNTYNLTCYDKILYSMKQNEDLGISYPITIKNYLTAVVNKIGLTLKTTTFQNASLLIQNELYAGLEYTYRDILDELAEVTGSIICLNENDEVIVKYPTQTNDTINEEFLKDVNVDFGQKYGVINSIVLSRSGESDNVYLRDEQSVQQNGLTEVKIIDNQIMNFNDRSDYLQGILNALDGLYYYLNDFSSTGIMYYEVGDLYNVQIGENTYQCLMLNDDLNITTGIEELIHTDLAEQSETDYTKADKTDRRINQTYLIVDKQNQQIEALITTQTDQNQKIARVTQTVDELNSKISDIADVTTSLESNSAKLNLENINQSEPVRIVVHPLVTNIAKLHPHIGLKPRTGLKPTTRIIRFTNTKTNEIFEYEIPADLLYYDSENYDEFVLDYDSQTCIINKKCKWNSDGTVGLLASTRTDEYTYPKIELTDGDYEIKLIQYNVGYLFARLMVQNIYTTQFATKAEVNSDIKQTVDNINLSVNKKLTNYSTTTEMNSAIDLKANEITSSVSQNYATKSELNSAETSLNSKIDQTAESISLTVDSVEEKVETAQSTANTATTKADNAQTSANSAQSTANSATTKANNAQTTANNAQKTADNINTNLTTNYYTKTQTNSAINQKADSITSTVSKTYSTKTETTQAKNDAINSANTSTDNKLKSYSTTTQMNSAIEQKANSIISTVSETYSTKTEINDAINNIEIGGRNLLLGSSAYQTGTPYSLKPTSDDTHIRLPSTRASVTKGKTYYLQCNTDGLWSKHKDIGNRYCTIWIVSAASENEQKISVNQVFEGNKQETGRKTWKWVSNITGTVGIRLNVYGEGNATVKFWNLKLEEGTKPTDWTAPDEDYSTTVQMNSAITQKANEITSTVSETYSTKTQTTQAKNDAISSANTNTDNKLKNYSTTTQMNSAITQKANEINTRIDQIEEVTNETSGTKTIVLSNCVKGKILKLEIYGNNSVFDQLYPTNALYPANTLYPYGNSQISVKYANGSTKTYELGITEVLRKNGDVYDEYILENGQAKVIRRINSNGTIKSTPTTQNLGSFSIELENGTNTITIKDYSADLYAKYAIKSAYTDIFATQVQMNSSITQTAEEISLEVSKKVGANEIISKINQSAEAVSINANKVSLNGKNINLTGDNVSISSNNFNVDRNGNMSCSNATISGSITSNNANITGGKIKVKGGRYNTDLLRVEDTDSRYLSYLQPGAAGFVHMDSSYRIDIATLPSKSLIDVIGEGRSTEITDSYVKTQEVIQTSLESQKKNFEKYQNALDVIKNIDIYKYNLKTEEDGTKKHIGFVIGKDFKYSEEVTSKKNDGADIYSFVSLCCQAIKEQQEEIEKLRKEINNG